jgi:4-hydroxybenzoate polyprenyltransferase
MSQVFWLLVVLQLFAIFILPNLKYLKILINNFPLTRIIYWSVIALIGIYLSQNTSKTIDIFNLTTIVSFCVIFLLGVLNTIFAVCINDAEDENIDIISNPTRPLVTKELSHSQWNKLTIILLVLIILGLATMNSSVAFFLILTQMSYYIYSARPLRLKRNFISSSIIVGLASTTVAMAGFFFTSSDQHLSAFPIKAILMIAISFASLSNMKDIKDFAGDKKEGMMTMPVVFGLENSKKLLSLIYALVFITIPFLLEMNQLIFFSIICSIFTFYLFTKKQYQEKYIFIVLFFYAAMLFMTGIFKTI